MYIVYVCVCAVLYACVYASTHPRTHAWPEGDTGFPLSSLSLVSETEALSLNLDLMDLPGLGGSLIALRVLQLLGPVASFHIY